MNNNNIIKEIRRKLEENVDKKTNNNFQRFFKEEVKYYGVKTNIVEKIAKENFNKIKSAKWSKKEILKLCSELFKSGFCEEAWIAANVAYYIHEDYAPEDFKVLKNWVENYIDNWAKCDTLCNHAIGSLIEQYPKLIEKLKIWTKSKNRWVKRAAAVSLIIPARKGMFLKDIFEISDSLLIDQDDMVQKGYGWMLKEASRKHQKEVFEYVMRNKKVMPRTAFRYAIEKLPPDLKQKAMEK